jgi:hypothetical protein
MSNNNNTEATGKTFFHMDDDGDSISIKVEGTAGDLINLFANTMAENDDLKKVIEMALMAVDMKAERDESDDDSDSPDEEGEQK